LKSFIESVGQAFKTIYNEWLDTTLFKDIQVNGGTCTCKIVSGTPIPGTYNNGIGEIAILSESISTNFPRSVQIKNEILKELKSQMLQAEDGIPTSALKTWIKAIAEGITSMQNQWLDGTKMESLQVNGGLTFPNSPIVGAQGKAGKLV